MSLTGEVRHVGRASADDGSWTHGTLAPAGGGADVPFAGADLPPYLTGCHVRLDGYWEPFRDERTGETRDRFVALACEATRPADAEAVERYVAAHVDGCGPEGARRIVRVLGADCLDRLFLNPELVRPLFPGARGEAAVRAWRAWGNGVRQDTRAHQLAVRLLTAGVTYGLVRRIMRFFGSAQIAEIAALRHPYRLVEVPGVGWRRADRVARLLGVAPDAPERLGAAVRYALTEAARRGHSGLPAGSLAAAAGALLAGPDRAPERALRDDAPIRTTLATAVETARRTGAVRAVGAVLLPPDVYAREWALAERVASLARVHHPLTAVEMAATARVIDASNLSAPQAAAVRLALEHGVSVLTGRPGAGKTTAIKTYVDCCHALGREVRIVAPSGKAAARAADVTGVPASTVHRLLGGHPGREPVAITAEALVVDETSLLGMETAAWLATAVDPARTSILFTGDVDQLPSVEHGQVLTDLIASGMVPVARLTDVFRQRAGSRIVANAHRLLDGQPLDVTDDEEWRLIPLRDAVDGPDRAAAWQQVVGAVRDLVAGGADPATDVQVLAPLRGGPLGVDALNRALQWALNPRGRPGPMVGGAARARVGDRVVMTRNLYDLPEPLFNGETGVVVDGDAHARRIVLDVGGREVTLRGVQCLMLRLAWALTVHRSQGSEYPHVVLAYDHRAHAGMLDPGVLYTAITRAARRLTLVGTRSAITMTQSRAARRGRHTGLAEQIRFAAGLGATRVGARTTGPRNGSLEVCDGRA